MIYEFKCECGEVSDFVVPLRLHSQIKDNVFCQCGGEVKQTYKLHKPINRTAFPRNFMSEHVAQDPVLIKDEGHFKGLAAENGLTVTNPWDGI